MLKGAPYFPNPTETGTLIHMYAFYGYTSLVRRLIQFGVDPNSKTSASKLTPIDFASAGCHDATVKELVTNGAKGVNKKMLKTIRGLAFPPYKVTNLIYCHILECYDTKSVRIDTEHTEPKLLMIGM